MRHKPLVLLLLLGLGSAASAATTGAADFAFERFMQQATGTGATSFSLGTNGLPVPGSTPPTVTLDGGLPKVNTGGSYHPPAGGAPVPVAASGRIPAANISKALGTFFVKAAPVAYWAQFGMAGYQLMKELGFIGGETNGALTVRREQDGVECLANYGTSTYANTPGVVSTKYCVPVSAGSSSYNYGWSHSSAQFGWTGVTFPCGNATCPVGAVRDGVGTTTNVRVKENVPSTFQEFLDAVAARGTWPETSKIRDVLNDAGRAGVKTDPGQLTVTGPATSQGTQTQKTNADGTITTTNTTNNHTYNDNKVTTTTTTVTTTTTATGTPISQTTETTTKPAETPPEIETCGLPGKPACKIDETGTPEMAPTTNQEKIDEYKTKMDEQRDQIKQAGTGIFDSFGIFFSAPPFAACTPYTLPRDMGSVNPCPVVDGVRSVMAYIWALGALFLCVGWIREAI